MPRKIEERRTKRALRKLRQAMERARERGEDMSEWEEEFAASVEERLETFGSAFADPEKGDLKEPLSARQSLKLRELDKKSRGKARKPLQRRKPMRGKAPPPPEPEVENEAPPAPPPGRKLTRADLRVIDGDDE